MDIFFLLLGLAVLWLICLLVGIMSFYTLFTYIWTWVFYGRHVPPVIPSHGGPRRAMLVLMKELIPYPEKDLVIADLGSGWGSLVLPIAKAFPRTRIEGYEFQKFAYLISRLRGWLNGSKNTHFYHRDFFKTDLSHIRVVVCFLYAGTNEKLRLKLHCDKGSFHNKRLIFSNSFIFPGLTPIRVVKVGLLNQKLYVYRL